MNILAINNLNPIKFYNDKKKRQSYPYFGISLQKPLDRDTVSFKAAPTEKLLTTRTGGVSKATAIKINQAAEGIQGEIENFIRGLYRKHLCSLDRPNNLIEYVAGRAKKPDSIVEKSKIIQEDTIGGIFLNMTDLNGTKIVVRDASRKNVHKALDILLDAVEHGLVFIEEVEVKRPKASEKLKVSEASKWDYADIKYLKDVVQKAEKAMGKKINFPDPQLTKVNYTAIHFLLRLPGQQRVFELQLIGYNVAELKDLDDILFKVLNNKNVDKEYAPIVEILKPLVLSPQEINMLKYIKLKNKLDKLKFTPEEIEILKSRQAMDSSFCVISDPPGFCEKTKMLVSKDFDESAMELLFESDYYDVLLADTEAVKELKKKEQRFEKFNKYRAEAFLFQREKKTCSSGPDHVETFKRLTDIDLPLELDLNYLYKIFVKCKAELKANREEEKKLKELKQEAQQLAKKKKKYRI